MRLIHARRSSEWVTQVAKHLLAHTQANSIHQEFLAFYRANAEGRQIFGLNEFLYDIVIGQIIDISTASGKRHPLANDENLRAIQQAVWVVESEFELKNSRSILLDLNKLVISKAQNKLLIISQDENSKIKEWTKETIKKLMYGDDANIYLACVPHPKNWMPESEIQLEEII